MKVTDLELDGLKLIEPRVFGGERGYFLESYHRAVFRQAGVDVEFVQDNQSCFNRGVVRGLHFQLPPNVCRPESLRAIRPDDPTFGIDWQRDVRQAILSIRDRAGRAFVDSEKL